MISEEYKKFLIEPNEEGLDEAAALLRNGDLLAFPTETVYGLGANALNVDAVLNIFKAKGRPLTDPLIVHVAEPAQAWPLVDITPVEQQIFALLGQHFWPGPLTMIVHASKEIPPPVTANTGFVGIRCPKHALAKKLLEKTQLPIAAPSANRFGHVSPTRAIHVLADLAEKGVRVLNGESSLCPVDESSCAFGIESTVVKLDADLQQIQIFRQGAITQIQIEHILQQAHISWNVISIKRTVKMHATKHDHNPTEEEECSNVPGQVAPGQAVTHYAPDVPCYIVETCVEASTATTDELLGEDHIALSLSVSQLQVGTVVIDYGGQLQKLQSQVLAYRDLSSSGNSAEAARNLFDALRWSEGIEGAERVLVAKIAPVLTNIVLPEASDMTLGVADRVFRAASGVHAHVTIL